MVNSTGNIGRWVAITTAACTKILPVFCPALTVALGGVAAAPGCEKDIDDDVCPALV